MRAFHTENYLGKGREDYFEGWYFRHGGKTPFSFIVGVTKSNDAHSFVQYIDGKCSRYFRFDLSEFSFSEEEMTIRVGKNRFSLAGIEADLGEGNERVRCNVAYDAVTPFQKSAYAPSVMGPFTYLSMLCNHAVVSMRHNASGTLEANGTARKIDGFGYIEKDFGSRFPQNYFWFHAADDSTSIMFAVAWPLNFRMRGFLCVLSHGGRQYNLSLYMGAKLAVCDLAEDRARVTVRRGRCELSFEAESIGGMELAAPGNGGGMTDTICENLSASCRIALRLAGEQVDLSGLTDCAFESEICRA